MSSELNQDETCFSHTPVRPVRQDVLGEVVFMEHWLKLMAQELPFEYDIDPPNEMLKHILWDVPSVLTERHAQVCASLIRWLGTNNGRAFLERADNMSIRLRSREQGYQCAWTLENQRRQGTDYGWRAIEAVLSPEALTNQRMERPALSFEDSDTIDVLMGWMGSEKGEQFLVDCRKEIEKRLRHNRDLVRENHMKGLRESTQASL